MTQEPAQSSLTLLEQQRLSLFKARYRIEAIIDPDDTGTVNARKLVFLRWLIENRRHPEFP